MKVTDLSIPERLRIVGIMMLAFALGTWGGQKLGYDQAVSQFYMQTDMGTTPFCLTEIITPHGVVNAPWPCTYPTPGIDGYWHTAVKR